MSLTEVAKRCCVSRENALDVLDFAKWYSKQQNAEYRKLIKEICGIVKNVGGDEWYDKTGEFLNRPEVKQILEEK